MNSPKRANYNIAPHLAEPYNTRVPGKSLHQTTLGNGAIIPQGNGWRLQIPPGEADMYRLAQLDNYAGQPRRRFPLKPLQMLRLRARASSRTSPGTWGFGLWNDPFAAGVNIAGFRRLPALPQAAWFFFPAERNHLSLRDDQPGNLPHAGVYASNPLAYLLLPLGLPLLPLLLWPPGSRLLRKLAAQFIYHDLQPLTIDPTQWHTYQLTWHGQTLDFHIDDELVAQSAISPRPPLGLVIWIDNQFAAWRPDGGLEYGTLSARAPHWIEIADLEWAA